VVAAVPRRRCGRSFVDAVLIVAAGQFLVFGVWAFGWPHSFYTTIAHFPSFSRHLVHDAGAFQVGIGSAMLPGRLWQRDALLAVLA